MDRLVRYFRQFDMAAVAFSGGVDSSVLLTAAHKALGDRAVAITADMDSFPERELGEAGRLCGMLGVRQIICRVEQLDINGFVKNDKERCYICKKAVFGAICSAAKEMGADCIAEGSNADDVKDYRPGMKAVEELGIVSPLKELGYTKADIRMIAKEQGLDVWDKPAYACLATRIAYGEPVTYGKLAMIENAEEYIMALGIRQVRVRLHGDIARIEVLPEYFDKVMEDEVRTDIVSHFKDYGFKYVTLDIQGFRSGSMN